jgi:hypothetical protein
MILLSCYSNLVGIVHKRRKWQTFSPNREESKANEKPVQDSLLGIKSTIFFFAK